MQGSDGALPATAASSATSGEHIAKLVRRRPSKLRGAAILHVEGVEAMGQRSWSREVAFVTLDRHDIDGHAARAWLVAPEALWPRVPTSGHPEPRIGNLGLGHGLVPSQVVRELAEAARGRRVYAECHLTVRHWLRALFTAAGFGEQPFPVRDIILLLVALKPSKEDINRVGHALGSVPLARRASMEALAHARFLDALAARVEADDRKPSGRTRGTSEVDTQSVGGSETNRPGKRHVL